MPRSRLGAKPNSAAKRTLSDVQDCYNIIFLSFQIFKRNPERTESGENPWVKVRGLNASFLKTLQGEVEKDALVDLSRFFGQYIKFWNQLADNNTVGMKNAVGSPAEPKPIEALLPPAPVQAEKPAFTFAIPAATTASVETTKPFSFSMPPTKPAAATEINLVAEEKPKKEEPAFAEKPAPFSFSLSKPSNEINFSLAKPSNEISFSLPKPSNEGAFSFSFGAPSTATTFGMLSPGATQSQPKDVTTASAEADDEPLEPPTIAVIRTGAGEEGEECLAEARVKLFIFGADKSWVDLGVGIFKVNKRKDEGAGPNRILCRGEASGLVLLNSAITKDGTKVDWPGQKDVKITCVNQEGKLASYLVRNKEVEGAKQLADAINSLLA